MNTARKARDWVEGVKVKVFSSIARSVYRDIVLPRQFYRDSFTVTSSSGMIRMA